MSRQGAPSWLAAIPGEVYTLHFWPPFGDPEVQASGHYTGWTHEGRLGSRLVDHYLGRGARLTQLQRQAGGSWVVADVEPGTIDREHQLKYRSASRRCSICRACRDIEAGRITQEEALAKWADAGPAERSILREIFGMEPEAEKAPEPAEEFVPAPRPEPAAGYGPEVDAFLDALEKTWASPAAGPERVPGLSPARPLGVPAPRAPELETAPSSPEPEPEMEIEL